jgi:Holliday junction resolvase RusA-like endonuclease
LDAATKAGIWGDDSQVVPLASTKRFTEPGEEPGVYLHIGRLREDV